MRKAERQKRQRIRFTIYLVLGLLIFTTGFFHYSSVSNAEGNSVETLVEEKVPERREGRPVPMTMKVVYSSNPNTGASSVPVEVETVTESSKIEEETKTEETEPVETKAIETEINEGDVPNKVVEETTETETTAVETEAVEPEVVEEAETEKIETANVEEEPASTWDGPVLNSYVGTVQGPSGKETYYNLDMSGIVSSIESRGWLWNDIAPEYRENVSGGYWVRDDGVKMYGNYIMIAANLDVHPRGSLVETSLGTGVVLDTGGFAAYNSYQVDIAVTW